MPAQHLSFRPNIAGAQTLIVIVISAGATQRQHCMLYQHALHPQACRLHVRKAFFSRLLLHLQRGCESGAGEASMAMA